MNGHYNNTLDDLLLAGDLAGCLAELDWHARQRQGRDFNFVALYASTSVLRSPLLPQVVREAYLRRLRLGWAYSTDGEVDALLAYQRGRTDARERFTFGVTEYEPQASGRSYAGFTALLERNGAALRAAGLRSVAYANWLANDFWPTLVRHVDEVLLHCYLPSSRMNAVKIWEYVADDDEGHDRLVRLGAAAEAAGLLVRVTPLWSSEPSFALDYFKANRFEAPVALFLSRYDVLATPAMQRHLVVGDGFTFVSRYSRQARP